MSENLPAIRPPVKAGGAVGALVPQTIDEAWRLSEAFAKAKILPRGITEAPQVMLIICGGAEVGFGPFQSLQSFYLVNNRLTLWGDAIPALLWSNGFKIKEWYENADPAYPDNMVAKCKVTRPDGEEIEGEFSVSDAKEAKLWTKEGPWQTSRKRMLKMRARAFAARDGAPDVLRGVAIREEVEDYDLLEVTQVTAPPALTSVADEKAPKRRRATPEPQNDPPAASEAEVEDIPAEEEKPAEPKMPASHVETAPHAAPDEVYLLAGDSYNADKRRVTYKDGVRFSSVHKDTASKFVTYARHAPERPTSEEEPTETASAPDAEIEPDTSAPVTDASNDGAEASDSGLSPEADDDAEEPLPPDFQAFADAVESVADWASVKRAMADFWGSDTFKVMTLAAQNRVRADTWETCVEGKEEKRIKDLPDHADDCTAFRLWVETVFDPPTIEFTFGILKKSDSWAGASEPMKAAIMAAVALKVGG